MTEPPRAHGDRDQVRADPDWRVLLTSPTALIALGFGTGLSPIWPGTVGSLLGFPLFWSLRDLAIAWQGSVLAVLFVGGIWVCDRAGRDLAMPDHSAIVWDEIWAMALVLLCAPAGGAWMLASFVAFRLFDIIKPWPANLVDRRMKNGFGVMLDDLLAALYAIASLALLHAALPPIA